MTGPSDDEARLRRLLSDTVSSIEPEDRIAEIRASVRPDPKVVPMSRPRSWYAAAGIVATAAVIGVIAYVTSVAGNNPSAVGPAGDSGTALPHESTATATDSAAPQPSTSATPQFASLPVYYLGHGPGGRAVLYRQAIPVSPDQKPLDAAVSGLASDPFDADYRAAWSPGWLVSATLDGGVIQVDLGSVPTRRPASMSSRTTYETVQSAVYTLQAATHSHAPVRFTRSGRALPLVLGVPTDRPVTAGHVTDVLSLMNITSPALDGLHERRGRLVVTGLNNGFEATVALQLKRGGHVFLKKAGMATGWTGDRLYPWRLVLDTSRLDAGRYTLVASNDDPSGRGRAAQDTRIVYLK